MENLDTIEKLAEGYSTQSKTTNQFWLVLIITSIIAITGQVKENQIALPFTLGTVSTTDFYTISIILISVLTIAYTSAMAQAIRARMLIQLVIDKMDNKFIDGIHIQDFVDAVLTPTYNRVAPISQFILGKKQFLGQGKQNNH